MKKHSSIVLLALTLSGGLGIASAQMTVVNGASFDSTQPMAPGSFATVFGQDLCSQTVAGNWIAPGQLPTSLGSCSVAVDGMPANACSTFLPAKSTSLCRRTSDQVWAPSV